MNRKKKYLALFKICLFIFLSGCSKKETELTLLNKTVPEGVYGKNFSYNTSLSVSELFKNSEEHIDKKIIVKGKIIEVCPMRGCWVKVVDSDDKASIRIKVEDGLTVFPLSAVGAEMIVEGILRKRMFSQKQAMDWKVHLAQEKGEVLNLKSVRITPEDMYEYRVECSGAIIL